MNKLTIDIADDQQEGVISSLSCPSKKNNRKIILSPLKTSKSSYKSLHIKKQPFSKNTGPSKRTKRIKRKRVKKKRFRKYNVEKLRKLYKKLINCEDVIHHVLSFLPRIYLFSKMIYVSKHFTQLLQDSRYFQRLKLQYIPTTGFLKRYTNSSELHINYLGSIAELHAFSYSIRWWLQEYGKNVRKIVIEGPFSYELLMQIGYQCDKLSTLSIKSSMVLSEEKLCQFLSLFKENHPFQQISITLPNAIVLSNRILAICSKFASTLELFKLITSNCETSDVTTPNEIETSTLLKFIQQFINLKEFGIVIGQFDFKSLLSFHHLKKLSIYSVIPLNLDQLNHLNKLKCSINIHLVGFIEVFEEPSLVDTTPQLVSEDLFKNTLEKQRKQIYFRQWRNYPVLKSVYKLHFSSESKVKPFIARCFPSLKSLSTNTVLVDHEFFNIESLKTLKISSCESSIVPFSLLSNSFLTLEKLELENLDQCEHIYGLEQLTSLKMLSLIQLPNLNIEKLSLHQNTDQLLQIIRMEKVGLDHIPICLCTKNLKSLSLAYNNIQDLPLCLKQCKKLSYLDLSHNRIWSLPRFLIYQMKQIHHLNVSYNHIEHIEFIPLFENKHLRFHFVFFANPVFYKSNVPQQWPNMDQIARQVIVIPKDYVKQDHTRLHLAFELKDSIFLSFWRTIDPIKNQSKTFHLYYTCKISKITMTMLSCNLTSIYHDIRYHRYLGSLLPVLHFVNESAAMNVSPMSRSPLHFGNLSRALKQLQSTPTTPSSPATTFHTHSTFTRY
mmetsp:Transcript_2055/g.2965  ORF Transcript_2055/g.2965 Transcript_2055/m.2965 type:complete len:779 (+) Transcript_2055:1210-3546(+)